MAIDDALNRNPRKNSFGDAAAAMSNPNVTQIPTGGMKAPAPDGSQNDPLNTDIGRNAKNAMMALPGIGGAARVASTGGAISSGINAVSSGVNAASRMMALSAGSAASGLASAQAPAAASTPVPNTQTGTDAGAQMATVPASAGAGRGSINPSSASLAAPLPRPLAAMAMQTTSDVKREGNSYSGTNVAGDITINGQAPRNGGQIGAQNMAAADVLAGRQRQESMGRATAAQQMTALPPGIPQQNIEHSGNSWQARMDLRKAEVSASSIMNNGGRWDQHGRAGSPEGDAYRAMLGTDQALRQAQPGMDQATMQQNAGLQREGMQQTGSTARAQMQELGQNSRFGQAQGLAQQKLGMEREAQSFQTRAAAQQEQLRNQIMQEQDPTKRQSIVQRMREMQGQTQPSEWGVQVTPTTKNVDGSTAEGSVIRYNKSTGQVERVETGQGGAQPSANHLAALRANPKQADFFDQVYGKGAAALILGGG